MNAFIKIFIILCCAQSITLIGQSYDARYQQFVGGIENDAIEYGNATGEVILDAFGMTITESWSEQVIGLRFDNLPIPPGSKISNAYIQFYCKDPDKSTGPSDLQIRAELNPNAAAFEAIAHNITDRPTTPLAINWQPPEWRWQDYGGLEERSPNLADILQLVIDQNEWQLGNAGSFIFTGTGQRSAHNFISEHPPFLFVEYQAPNPTDAISQIFINEIAPNGTTFADDTNDFEDWVEFYNDNDFDVNLGGLFFSDKKDNLRKWQIANPAAIIPAKGFLIVWADSRTSKGGMHANFSLNKDGETLILSQLLNNQLSVIDSMSYGDVPFKASFGRINEEPNNWSIFGEATPMTSNGAGLGWIEAPVIDLPEGIYSSEQNIHISHIDPEVEIRYSLDGNEPNQFSIPYNNQISISSTKTLRARAFKNGSAPSAAVTKSYLFNPAENLPVIMLTTDPNNLFDEETGIYVEGNGAHPVFVCGEYQTANFYQDWERPAHLTFIENDGYLGFSVDAGIRIAGSCSRKYGLKTLNVYLRNNVYGDKDIGYNLFPDRDLDDFKRLKLRNSGQDYRGTMLRDGVNQAIIGHATNMEYQAYRPTVVYINGEYWGIENLREQYGEKYFNQLFSVDEEEIDILKNQEFFRQIKAGDDIHFQNMYSFVFDNDLTDFNNFDYLASQMDMNSFIDYWISMLYLSNTDWPANNKQIWRPRTAEGKWRWMLLDTDGSTNLSGASSDQGHLSDKLSQVLQDDVMGWPNDSRSTLIFRKLIDNIFFRSEFIQRACTFMELVFQKDRVLPIIDQYHADLSADIERHLERWADDNPNLTTKAVWEQNVTKFRNFYEERPSYFHQNLMDNLSVEDTFELNFHYDEFTDGDIVLHWNEWPIPFNYSGTYYKNQSIRIKAIPKQGFEFSHWAETGIPSAQIDLLTNTNATTLTPVFVEATSSAQDLSKAPNISVYPNPASIYVQLNTTWEQPCSISIIHQVSGMEVFNKIVGSKEAKIQIEDWAPGVYLILCNDLNGNISYGRFVKFQ